MLILIFALSVPSFAMSITNWPDYFTGIYDQVISQTLHYIFDDVAEIERLISLYIGDIWADVGNIYSFLEDWYAHQLEHDTLEIEHWQNQILYLSGINSGVSSVYSLMQTQHRETMVYLSDELEPNIVSAIGGVTSSIFSFNQDFRYQFDPSSGEGSAGYALYMLQQVLADEDDLKFKQDNASQKDFVLDFASGGVEGSLGTSFNFVDSAFDSIDILNQFFGFFDMGIAPTDFFVFLGDAEPWAWFTSENDMSINGIQTYSRNNPVIVTDFYGENKKALEDILKGGK